MNTHPQKTIIITGATAGIGKATALALASQGHKIVVVGRSAEKTDQTVAQIRALTGSEHVDGLLADFADLAQVRRLAQTIQDRYPRVDVLLNNAGGYFDKRVRTSAGMEKTLFVNHLAPFLLTNLLLDLLKRSAPARIVNVSSNAHRSSKDDFRDLEYRRFYVGIMAYARSKLANVLFTYELARRLDGSGVTANALHPGFVNTDIFQLGIPVVDPLIRWFNSLVALTPEQGADTSIYLASSPEVEGATGKYFVRRSPTPSSALSYDRDLALRLWELSVERSGLV